jgi:8-oxo-dGTP pyrophosphatase MutT (NUDIX family)
MKRMIPDQSTEATAALAGSAQGTELRPLSPRLLRALESFDGVVVPPRDAATIVLLRSGAEGLQVFLLRRQASMAFASGMHVFPGGGAQDSDHEAVPWMGPPPEAWAEAFGCSTELARALVIAGIRETFEETGVLLAGPDLTTVTGLLPNADELRSDLERHQVSFADALVQRGLHVRADLLAPWAHWITPDFEPRRYDTRFFVAMLPEGQVVGGTAGEAESAQWHCLSDVIDQARDGQLAIMPPTLHVCRQLVDIDPEGLLPTAWGRRIRTVAPRVVEVGGRRFLDTPLAREF